MNYTHEDIRTTALEIAIATIEDVPTTEQLATMNEPAITAADMEARANRWAKSAWNLAVLFHRTGNAILNKPDAKTIAPSTDEPEPIKKRAGVVRRSTLTGDGE